MNFIVKVDELSTLALTFRGARSILDAYNIFYFLFLPNMVFNFGIPIIIKISS